MSPKVYLCCSIRGGRCSLVPYDRLVQLLAKHAHVVNPFVTEAPQDSGVEGGALSDSAIHDRDLRLLQECDVLVAEVSQPSFGVGYEVGRAVELRKPVLALHCPSPDRKLSAMIGWAEGASGSAQVQLRSYSDEQQLVAALADYFTQTDSPAAKAGQGIARQTSLDWKSYEPM